MPFRAAFRSSALFGEQEGSVAVGRPEGVIRYFENHSARCLKVKRQAIVDYFYILLYSSPLMRLFRRFQSSLAVFLVGHIFMYSLGITPALSEGPVRSVGLCESILTATAKLAAAHPGVDIQDTDGAIAHTRAWLASKSFDRMEAMRLYRHGDPDLMEGLPDELIDRLKTNAPGAFTAAGEIRGRESISLFSNILQQAVDTKMRGCEIQEEMKIPARNKLIMAAVAGVIPPFAISFTSAFHSCWSNSTFYYQWVWNSLQNSSHDELVIKVMLQTVLHVALAWWVYKGMAQISLWGAIDYPFLDTFREDLRDLVSQPADRDDPTAFLKPAGKDPAENYRIDRFNGLRRDLYEGRGHLHLFTEMKNGNRVGFLYRLDQGEPVLSFFAWPGKNP